MDKTQADAWQLAKTLPKHNEGAAPVMLCTKGKEGEKKCQHKKNKA